MVIRHSDRARYEPTVVAWYTLVLLASRRVLLGAHSRAPSQEVLQHQKRGWWCLRGLSAQGSTTGCPASMPNLARPWRLCPGMTQGWQPEAPHWLASPAVLGIQGLVKAKVGGGAACRMRRFSNGGKAGHTFRGSLYTRHQVRTFPHRLVHYVHCFYHYTRCYKRAQGSKSNTEDGAHLVNRMGVLVCSSVYCTC